jgi:CelD/BcsL family acetyltransferase involved in cellulose biosynthesis
MQSWLETYGTALRPELFAASVPGHGLIGAGLLTLRVRRQAILPHVRAHLNCDGENAGHGVVVQHNSILAVPGRDDDVVCALARLVVSRRVDELAASGFDERGINSLINAFPDWTSEVDWREAHYVDLDCLRAAGGDHAGALSRNTREQLRRSLKLYRERGELRLEPARTVDEAEAMMDELVALHESHWQSKGHSGGFASDWRRRFHKSFIRAALPHGAVQLLRVTVGSETVGVLYNLVANGKVNFYQSGLRYETDGRFKPGMVVHHLAILYCLEQGMTEYDFLVSGPGEGRYKSSLSTHCRRMGWLVLYRPGWRGRYFSLLRAVRQWIASARLRPLLPGNAVTTTQVRPE